jgi:hypothetical protein
MPEAGKHNDHYSLEAIEAYLTGKLSPAEMHAMEKAAIQDPFLADAIEGFRETDLAAARRHLSTVDQQILAAAPITLSASQGRRNNFWRVAAAVLVTAGVATIALLVNNGSKMNPELATTTNLPSKAATEPAALQKDSTVIATAPVKDNTSITKQKTSPQLSKAEREKIAAALTAEGMAAKKKGELEAVAMAERTHAASLSQQENLSKMVTPSVPVNDTPGQQSMAKDRLTYAVPRVPAGGQLQGRRSFGNNAAAKKEAEAPVAVAALPPPPYAPENVLPAQGWDSLYHFLNQKLGATIRQIDLADATVILHLDDKGTVSNAEVVAGWPPAAAAALVEALRSGPHWQASGQGAISGDKKILISTARIQQWPLK